MQVIANRVTANKLSHFLAILALMTIPSLSYAESLAEAMEKCRLVGKTLERLVCYDQLAQRANTLDDSELQELYSKRPLVSPLPGANEDKQPVPSPAPEAQPKNTFGLESQIRRQEAEAAQEMTAVVSKIDTRQKGQVIITLEDGAVWRQTDTKKIYLKPGDTILITRGALGALYLKKVGTHKRIRVRRSK